MASDPADSGPRIPKSPARHDRQTRPPLADLGARLERMLAKVTDAQVRQYLRWFYDPDLHRRIKLAANKVAAKMAGRHRGGWAVFQHQADDLIQHSWRRICETREPFEDGEAFLVKFVKLIENYERGQRRTQDAKVAVSEVRSGNEPEAAATEAEILHFPSPEASVSARQELEILRDAISKEAPDLALLFAALVEGNLKPAELLARLDITPLQLDAQRKRLRRLAARVLRRER